MYLEAFVAPPLVGGKDERVCMRSRLPPGWGERMHLRVHIRSFRRGGEIGRMCVYMRPPQGRACVYENVRGSTPLWGGEDACVRMLSRFLRGEGRRRMCVYAAAATPVVGEGDASSCTSSRLPPQWGKRTHVCPPPGVGRESACVTCVGDVSFPKQKARSGWIPPREEAWTWPPPRREVRAATNGRHAAEGMLQVEA